jgi:hypothetical protein
MPIPARRRIIPILNKQLARLDWLSAHMERKAAKQNALAEKEAWKYAICFRHADTPKPAMNAWSRLCNKDKQKVFLETEKVMEKLSECHRGMMTNPEPVKRRRSKVVGLDRREVRDVYAERSREILKMVDDCLDKMRDP